MPPLLKKKKQNPFSRFVNDIRAARHGESLVVQTGFPTSLIDLVVKNRSRFIKNKNCKNDRYESFKSNKDKDRRRSRKKTEDEGNRGGDLDSNMDDDREVKNIIYQLKEVDVNERDEDDEEDHWCDSESEFRIEKCVKGGLSGGFTKLVKMLFVLILGLGTKKVALAITLSAFMLLFVEFFLRSCVVKKMKISEEEDNSVDMHKEFANMVKDKRVKEIGIELEKDEECDLIDGEVIQLHPHECDENIRNRRKSGEGKNTAKQFRKYVVKKFGGESKKRRMEAKFRDAQLNCNVESIGEEQEKDEEGDEHDDDYVEQNVVVEYERKCISNTRSSNVGAQDDTGRLRTNWNPKTFFLVVVVLVGLVSGRILAMVLSVVWLVVVIALSEQCKLSVKTRQLRC